MADAYRSIARIQKTHGRNGEVVAVPAHGLPLLLREGLVVAVVPPSLKGSRWQRIASCEDGRSGQLVCFEDVHTLGAAEKLVGKTLLARVDDLPEDYALRDQDELVGREVVDGRLGYIGKVCELMRGPENDVWVVRGPWGEVLIPAVEPIVTRWEPGESLCVDLPRGLVDEEGGQPCT